MSVIECNLKWATISRRSWLIPNYVESFRKSVLDRMINDVLLEQHAESFRPSNW